MMDVDSFAGILSYFDKKYEASSLMANLCDYTKEMLEAFSEELLANVAPDTNYLFMKGKCSADIVLKQFEKEATYFGQME